RSEWVGLPGASGLFQVRWRSLHIRSGSPSPVQGPPDRGRDRRTRHGEQCAGEEYQAVTPDPFRRARASFSLTSEGRESRQEHHEDAQREDNPRGRVDHRAERETREDDPEAGVADWTWPLRYGEEGADNPAYHDAEPCAADANKERPDALL